MWGLQTWPHVSLKPWAATRPTTALRQWLTSLMVNPVHPPSAHTTVREVVNAERGGNGWLNIWQLQSAQRLFLGDESPLLSQPQGAGTFTAQKSSFLEGAGGRDNKQHSWESSVGRRLWTKQKTWWSKVAACDTAHHHLHHHHTPSSGNTELLVWRSPRVCL